MIPPSHIAALCTGAALLGGCGGEPQDLRDWVARQHQAHQAATVPAVPPLPPAPVLEPMPYRGGTATDPFDPARLTAAMPPAGARVAAELRRAREPLEAFSLDALRMVGTLARDGQVHALVQAPDALYRVQAGDRVGPHFGRVLRITERGLTLRELVQDAAGAWSERLSTLELQEKAR